MTNLRSLFPNGSPDFFNINNPLPNPSAKRNKEKPLGKTAPRATGSFQRIGVCFTLFRVRLLDDDSAAASIKDLLDGLRHAAFLPDDAPGCIALTTQQEKVTTLSQEKTQVKITYPHAHPAHS